MNTTEKVMAYILDNPDHKDELVAEACNTTKGTAAQMRSRLRKQGKLPPREENWRRAPRAASPQVNIPAGNSDEKSVDITAKIRQLFRKKDVYTFEEVSNILDCGIGKVRQVIEEEIAAGVNYKIDGSHIIFSRIIERSEPKVLNIEKMSTGFYRFGVTGDNHLCSRYERQDVLNALYDLFEAEGITRVFNTGNWIDGEARFNKHDLKVHGLDNQLNYWIDNYPQRPGVVTEYITGDDHEGWYTQREGINVGKYAERKARDAGREDLVFLGHMEADIILPAPNGQTVVRVLHPGGGSAYAISYTSQKIVESYTGAEKPNILLDGHYHKAGYNYIRGVHVVQTACFTGNTRIKTVEGYKRIKDIQIGDLVLTHKNRYRKVTRLEPKRKASDFWRLNYGRKGRPDQTLTATSEHPILVERDGIKEWLPICEIIAGDKVFVVTSECQVTGEKIPYWMKLSENANPMHKQATRDKLSITKGGFKRKRAGAGSGATHMTRDIIPFCEQMQKEGWQIVPVGADVIPDAVGFKDGKIVLFELERQQGNNLEFKKNKYKGNAINGFIDSVQWIDLSEPKKQPRSFYEMDESGFVKVEVVSCEPVDKNSSTRKCETVYNFEVEQDNSYVAGNVVVHNCTQDQTPFMRKKRLAAHLGGWIIEFSVDEQGAITRFKKEFIPFYDKGYYEKWGYKWK
jgi:hypothetical protein